MGRGRSQSRPDKASGNWVGSLGVNVPLQHHPTVSQNTPPPSVAGGDSGPMVLCSWADPVELTAGQRDLGTLCACLPRRPFISRSLTVPAVSFFAIAYLFLDT